MLLVFLGFLYAMGYATNYSLTHGNVEKLMAPLDGDDHFCGQEAGYEEFAHLYIEDLSVNTVRGIFKSAVCVKACPLANETVVCKPTQTVATCPVAQYDSKAVLNYCFPKSISHLPTSMKQGWKLTLDAFLQNPIGKYFNDLYLSSRAIYWSMAMAVVYCFIYIFFMSAFAEQIAWFCVALTLLGLLGSTFALWVLRAQEIENYNNWIDVWN